MNASSEPRAALRAVCLAAVVVSLAACVYVLLTSPPTRFDDSYMFLRYANNILAGRGHAWNPDGVQVYGSTSLLHVGVVTLLKGCLPRAADATVLLVASALPGLATMLLLVLGCAWISTHRLLHRQYLLWAGLLLPVLVFDGTLRYHLQTGMDTMLAGLGNAVLILATLRLVSRPSAGRLAAVVAAGYLAFLARPDNGVYATLFPALAILLLVRGPRRKLLAVFALSLLAVLLADAAVKWLVFGSPLPLPFYAKQHGAYRGYANPDGPNPFLLLSVFLATALPFVCAVWLLARRETIRVLTALLVPVALTFGYYFSVNQIMGAAGRFYFPSLPFFVVAAAVVVDDRLRAAGEGCVLGQRELLTRLVILLLVIGVGREGLAAATARYQSTLPPAGTTAARPAYDVAAEEPLPAVDRWDAIQAMASLAERVPAGTVIALSEHGVVGARAPQATLIDLVGLHDRQFALHGFSAAELFRRKPDLIWLPHYHYTNILGGILQSDAFWRDYAFYPGAFDYGLAIRNDSPHRARLTVLVDQQWKALYGDRDLGQYRAVRRNLH
ncbi:MAG: hypothetical protein JXB62_19820 [Pirellulales bacterium]|nr:hypothetical protein [Pirellulales bacterium]